MFRWLHFFIDNECYCDVCFPAAGFPVGYAAAPAYSPNMYPGANPTFQTGMYCMADVLCVAGGGGMELGFVVGWLSTFVNEPVSEFNPSLAPSTRKLCFTEFLRFSRHSLWTIWVIPCARYLFLG